ncbi:MAG: sugar phosphate nucleotidyltransferase [Chloroherpetonaceae bacterium]|nr:sugar phosphate nucleotidyltransferase [Chloroherpetonaceae bacterium]MDW8438397.1 sugar phosphate nucleotidyltransferase [Chloroherpetonaceae bacterium]
MSLAIVIMAAGKGTRMKSDLAKVLHLLNRRPMIHYVLDVALELRPEKIIVVVGHQAEAVKAATQGYRVEYALQEPQLGTGHAVMQAEPALERFEGDVVVLSGDAPLAKADTLSMLLDAHREKNAVATVLTAILDDPTGYGRVIRNAQGDVAKMVEHKDASPAERAVKEINSGVYVFDKRKLFGALKRITNDNAQKEYYLPDVFNVFLAEGERVAAVVAPNFDEIRGVNTPEQLREAEAILLART